jgi:FixJ family two-component response regulator
MKAGAVKQLTKPVELQNLLTTVQEVVKRHRELFSSVEN